MLRIIFAIYFAPPPSPPSCSHTPLPAAAAGCFALCLTLCRRNDPHGGNAGGPGGGPPGRGDFQKGGKGGGRGGDGSNDAPGNKTAGGKEDRGGAAAENGDEGWSRGGSSSISPLIPPFMRKLFMALPRHMGPQPNAEGLLKALRERALPDKPR